MNNDELAYAVTVLLRCFDKYNDGYTTKTRFNKLIYMLNSELIKDNIDIRLPYFWYLYGPVTPLNLLPEGLLKLIEKPWGTGIKINEYQKFNLTDTIKAKIERATWNVYNSYSQFDAAIMTKKVINSVYKIAPYSFQGEYRAFQYQIRRKIRDKEILLKLGPLNGTRDIASLDEVVRVYDKKEFPEVYRDLLQWKLLVNYQLKQLLSIDGDLLLTLLDSYWHVFCQVLKIRCNNNLPSPLIRKWSKKLPEDIMNYRIRFMKIEEDFYSSIYVSEESLSTDLYEAYNKTIIKKMFGDI